MREAAGLSHAAVSGWCNISVQPVLDAYSEAIAHAAHLNLNVSRRDRRLQNEKNQCERPFLAQFGLSSLGGSVDTQ